ncbi:MAG: hypothetical protein Greene041619_1118 [Candidatus Peregrinibacteria bacterium Greene0416_19]|nr:MAG: hypothetical protein Greene041619_1118 [Candidatus Peregrinibacteria bacterium Greene0416_19]
MDRTNVAGNASPETAHEQTPPQGAGAGIVSVLRRFVWSALHLMNGETTKPQILRLRKADDVQQVGDVDIDDIPSIPLIEVGCPVMDVLAKCIKQLEFKVGMKKNAGANHQAVETLEDAIIELDAIRAEIGLNKTALENDEALGQWDLPNPLVNDEKQAIDLTIALEGVVTPDGRSRNTAVLGVRQLILMMRLAEDTWQHTYSEDWLREAAEEFQRLAREVALLREQVGDLMDMLPEAERTEMADRQRRRVRTLAATLVREGKVLPAGAMSGSPDARGNAAGLRDAGPLAAETVNDFDLMVPDATQQRTVRTVDPNAAATLGPLDTVSREPERTAHPGHGG